MAVSHGNGHSRTNTYWRRLFGQLTRYDLVLAAIPLALALPLLAHVTMPISLHVAVAIGAVLSGLFVADALFLNPPREPGSDTS